MQSHLPDYATQDDLDAEAAFAFWRAVEDACFNRLYHALKRHLEDAVPSVLNADDYETFFVATYPHAFEGITETRFEVMDGDATDDAQVSAAVDAIYGDMYSDLHMHILEALVNAAADGPVRFARPTLH